jgi:hypothetical protein
MTTETPIQTGNNGGRKVDPRKIGNMIELKGQTPLAKEFIIPGDTFEEALANTTIDNPNFLNNIVQLKAQMDMFNKIDPKTGKGIFDSRIQALVNLLNGQNSLKGYGRSISAMVGTGIYVPTGAGVPLSKEDKKSFTDAQRLKYGKRDKEEEEKGE